MKGLPCHKTTPVSGFRKCRLGAKVPLRQAAFSDCGAHESSGQTSASPTFLGSLSELLPSLLSADQLLFILQSPSLNTPSLGGAPPGLVFAPSSNIHNRHPMQSAGYPSYFTREGPSETVKSQHPPAIKKPWPSLFLTGGCPVSLA